MPIPSVLCPTGRRADKLIEVMRGRLDCVVGAAPGDGAERDEELSQQRHRIGLGVGWGALDELTRRAVQHGVARRRRPAPALRTRRTPRFP